MTHQNNIWEDFMTKKLFHLPLLVLLVLLTVTTASAQEPKILYTAISVGDPQAEKGGERRRASPRLSLSACGVSEAARFGEGLMGTT
jgi:hypothetical protein